MGPNPYLLLGYTPYFFTFDKTFFEEINRTAQTYSLPAGRTVQYRGKCMQRP